MRILPSLVAIASTLLLSGCGGLDDLSVTPIQGQTQPAAMRISDKNVADALNVSPPLPAEGQPETLEQKKPPVCTFFEYSEWSRCAIDGMQSRTVIKTLPEGCSGGNPTLSQNCALRPPLVDDIGPKWDYVSLTPEIFKRIIQKIKNAPNADIKAVISADEQGSVTFYYSFQVNDYCKPSLKDVLYFEMVVITSVDENGQKYPNGPITDYYSMRDTDHDNFPEDYYTPGEPIHDLLPVCDPRIDPIPFTKDTIDGNEMASYWEAGMNYFAANLLK